MKSIEVPVSIGEVIDKITILRIKQEKIQDSAKQVNISKELAALEAACDRHEIPCKDALAQELEQINRKLWQIEDDIRDKERARTFDQGFIELARAVYVTNDERFAAKARINQAHGSAFQEEKSYQPYL